jgi:hypothetical protein
MSRVPGENREPPFEMVPDFRRDDVWTPAFAGVTTQETFYETINHGLSPFPSKNIFIHPDSRRGHDGAQLSGNEVVEKKPSGGEKGIRGIGVENVVPDDTDLHGLPIGRIPFDADGKPALGGDEDMVFLGRFPLHIIPGPEEEMDLGRLLLKLIVLLRHLRQVPEKKIDEEDHIRLGDGLAGGGFDNGTVGGKIELQGGEGRERPQGGLFLSALIKNDQPRMRGNEFDPDSAGFFEKIFESILLLLHPVLKVDLFHLGGIILDPPESLLHLLRHFPNSAFLLRGEGWRKENRDSQKKCPYPQQPFSQGPPGWKQKLRLKISGSSKCSRPMKATA